MKISPGKHLRGFGAKLWRIKSIITHLSRVFTITEQDLTDAGIYLRR